MRQRLGFALVFALILVWSLPHQARAGEPEKKREFVWGISAFNGMAYTGTCSPPGAPTIYLMVGEKHVLTAGYTLVYYWPIDHEYKPDWASLNEPVDGSLELTTPTGQVIQRLQPDDFMLTSADMTTIGSQRLLLGVEAVSTYRNYEIERDKFLEASAKYSNDVQEYWRLRAQDPNRTDIKLPDPPESFTKQLAAPSKGFVVQIQPGTYQIQVRLATGQVLPESRRTVIGVAPQRESIGYTVIPEAKWTTPEISNDPSQIIYFSRNGTTVYLQPNHIKQFNVQYYARMENPQNVTAAANQWTWVAGKPVDGVQLEVWTGSRLLTRVPMKPYAIEQLPGAALGYKVIPFQGNAETQPDFSAFEVSVVSGVSNYTVRLVDGNGAVVPGSERTLVQANDDMPVIAYGLALLPLLAAVALSWHHRRQRARSLKELADAGV